MSTTPTNVYSGDVNIWHTARSGRADIRLYELEPWLRKSGERFAVYALNGHELLPRTKHFVELDEARAYANNLWRTL